MTGDGPADAATVIVFPTDRDAWTNYGTSPRRLRNVRVDKTGAFSIGNLPAGEYFVAAVPEAWPRLAESEVPRRPRGRGDAGAAARGPEELADR